MQRAIDETARRRRIQQAYNEKHHIIPQTIHKDVREVISNVDVDKTKQPKKKMIKQEKLAELEQLEAEMKEAAKNLDFERAMELRDALFELKSDI